MSETEAKGPQLLTRVEGAVAHITFNRPEVRNAVNREMLMTMQDFLLQIEQDPRVRCIVLSGAGGHFISGGDVAGFQQTLSKSGAERRREFEARVQGTAGLFVALARVPQPVVASVRGAVAGAGLGFMAGADFVICADNAVFVLAHVHIGASPDGASSYYLPRLVGVRKAKELAMLGNKLTAQEALELGLINQVVSDAELEATTQSLVKRLVAAPRTAVQSAKRLMNASLGNSLEQQLQLEALGFAQAAESADFAEGVNAFLAKRRAVFNQGD